MEITTLKKWGNSLGLHLKKSILQQAGIDSDKQVSISVQNGAIVIKSVEKPVKVNLDKSTWRKQFKKAFDKGFVPQKSMWPDYVSTDADSALWGGRS